MSEPSRQALELAALSYFERLKEGASGPRVFDEDFYEDEIDTQIELAGEHADKYLQQLRTNAYSAFATSEARRLSATAKLGSPLPATSERELTRLVARAQLAFHRWFIHGLTAPEQAFKSGDELFDEQRLVAADGSATLAVPPQRVPTLTPAALSELGAEYLSRTKARGISDSHVTELERVLLWMQDAFGRDNDLNQLSKAQARGFRNDLLRLDIRKRGQKLSFSERMTDDVDQHLTYATVSRYWKSVQGFFRWCAAEGFIAHDPTEGLKLDRPRGKSLGAPRRLRTGRLNASFVHLCTRGTGRSRE